MSKPRDLDALATETQPQKRRLSLSATITMIAIAALVVSTFIIGITSYFMNRSSAIRENSHRALDIATTVALSIDTEAYKETVASGEMGEYWHGFKRFLDNAITESNLKYLYVLTSMDDTNAYYFAEGIRADDDTPSIDLGGTELLIHHEDDLADVFAGTSIMSDTFYDDPEFGSVTSGMSPIFDADGSVIGVVGADVGMQDALEESNQFGLLCLLMILADSIIIGLIVAFYLNRRLGRPVAELSRVAQKVARGELDVDISIDSNDEIGLLADSFRDMTANIVKQTDTLEHISKGDLSVNITPRSDKDAISIAMRDTTLRLKDMIDQILTLSAQVATESGQMASSARSLASGATSQASAVEQLSASITEISIQTKQNSDLAEKSATLANTIRDTASASFDQVEQLIEAVNEINQSSNAIRSVVKAIEDIAFQTNLLAFNASVEAARAGDMGKGFGVVSKEVQNLSRKTSESAKETAALISDALTKSKQGVDLAMQVHQSMSSVIENVHESDRVANEIAHSSKEQMIAIDQINSSITLVANVVHKNSTVAEQSASSSHEMSVQASNLASLVSQFNTKEKPKG